MADEKSYLDQHNSGVVKSHEETLAEAAKALKEIETQLEWQQKAWEIQEKLYGIMKGKLKMLNPEREFQADPAFWEAQQELQDIEHEKQRFMSDKQLSQLKRAVVERQKVYDELKGE